MSEQRVHQAFTIGKAADELYRYWRQLSNLPTFMDHLERVEELDAKRSRWTAKGPGQNVTWEADITTDRPGEMIGWRSVPGSQIDNQGEVKFIPAPGGRGTEVHVTLTYDQPGGAVGRLVAWLWGEDPKRQVREDLRHFKHLMETGHVPTVEGQPAGKRTSKTTA